MTGLYPYYYYRIRTWDQALALLQQSLSAEEMVCSLSSELFHIPQTKNLQGNNEMHSHLVPASYHRVTTVGCARRLVNGEQQQSIIATLTACIINAQKQDQGVRRWLNVMQQNASPEFKNVIATIIRWQDQAESSLAQAKEMVRSMGHSFPTENEAGEGYY